jgi:hypothetical protein
MGSYLRGINGAFSGKIGNVIGSSWRGIDYMKSLPRKSGKEPSLAQMEQHLRFAIAVGFLKPISSLVNVGFGGRSAQKVTGYNLAVRYILKNAIVGTFPDLSIDYTKVRISEGSIAPSMDANIVYEAGVLKFTWTDNSESEDKAEPDDKSIVLVYNPAKDRYLFLTGGALRSAAAQEMSLPSNFSGDQIEAYISFISRDGFSISNSTYLGSLAIL